METRSSWLSCWFFVFFVCNSYLLQAEQSTSLYKQTGFRQYSTEQGLSQNTINDFYQDSKGFMWVATESGLDRLDGNQITAFAGPEGGLIGNAVTNFKEDSQGALWVSTFDELIHIDKDYKKLERYHFPFNPKASNSSNIIVDVIEESSGLFWVATRDSLFQLKPEGREIIPFNAIGILTQQNIKIVQAKNYQNDIWLATNKGLYQFNKDNKNISKHLLPNEINNTLITGLQRINNNQIFVSSSEGSVVINIESAASTEAQLLNKYNISSTAKYKNNIFFAIDDQLHQYNTDTKTQRHLYSLSEILPRYTNYKITQLYIDSNEKLWIGTESQGAYVWEPNSLKFESITSATQNPNLKLSDNTAWNFAEDINNNYWVATENGLNYIDIHNKTIKTYLTNNLPEMNKKTASILYIHQYKNMFWLGTKDGLIKYNPSTQEKQIYHFNQKKQKQDFFIYSITQTPDEKLWLATKQGPVSFNPLTEKFHIEKNLASKKNSPINTYIKYHDNLLWLGYSDRIETFDIKKKVKRIIAKFDKHKRYYDLSLTSTYLDNNQLWVSFNGEGIYVIDLSSKSHSIIKHFSRKTGFVDNIVQTLIPDKNFLWASTHSGLVKINKNDFSFLVFDFYDGLPINEFNEGASFKTSQGKFLLGGSDGLLIISPNDLTTPKKNTYPKITSIQIQEQLVFSNGVDWKERKIQVNEADSLISFNLSVLDYLSPQKWRFEYWLTGEITTSPVTTTKNEVTFANLSSGEYQLNIQAVIPNYKKFKTVKIPFTITQKSWTSDGIKYFLYISFILATLIFFYKRSTTNKKLITTNKELEEKERRLELALLDKSRGIWDWKKQSNNLEKSTFTMLMPDSDNIIITLAQYKSYVHAEDQQLFKENWLTFLNGKEKEISLTFRVYFFESWIWCKIYGKLCEFDPAGTPIRATGTWLDISQEKLAEEKLRLYEKAIQSTRDIIFIIDEKLNILAVNNAYQSHTHYSPDNLLGKNIVDIAERRFGKEFAKNIEDKILNNKSWQGEATMPVLGSPSYPIDVRVDAISNDQADSSNYIMVMTDISLLNDRMETQKLNSYYDSLTGLPNKVLAKDRLSHAISHARSHQKIVVLIDLDLDNFDFHNQTLGKSAAREIIVNSSKRIEKSLNKDDTLARIDKDKFHIILENEEKIENVSFKINNILSELSIPQKISHSSVKITACIGVAYFPHDGSTSSKLIQHAESAKLQAQSIGNNQISYYQKDLNKRAAERLAMKASLQQALSNNQFYLVFQPKYHLKTNNIYGFEVFVRWRMSQGNIVYPSQFLKIAEEIGMMDKITEWLINQSFKTLSQWKQDGINTTFSLNLNPIYCQKVGASDYLLKKLVENQLSTSNIHIEINEKQFSENIDSNLKFINELNSNGFNVTLDDFGYGNTPFSYLKNLPVNTIKVDRNFIRNIGKDKNNDILLRSLITMINNLGQIPAAKGIEYEEQLKFLLKCGCHFGQGYYFSDPLTETLAREQMLK
ncbi:EAL domain-containing protein [Aliikangiella sp. IMCC44359]|uniref:EAL domain-containing protein n=1 Tax=Aliikangiella sp. IMCC44359 TaxID=3459125 RepID=UPI00403AF001